jgi:hypothetical protein
MLATVEGGMGRHILLKGRLPEWFKSDGAGPRKTSLVYP